MRRFTLEFRKGESADPKPSIVRTTLYDLTEAVSDAVQPEEEQLIAEVVSHLIHNGRSKYSA